MSESTFLFEFCRRRVGCSLRKLGRRNLCCLFKNRATVRNEWCRDEAVREWRRWTACDASVERGASRNASLLLGCSTCLLILFALLVRLNSESWWVGGRRWKEWPNSGWQACTLSLTSRRRMYAAMSTTHIPGTRVASFFGSSSCSDRA